MTIIWEMACPLWLFFFTDNASESKFVVSD